MEADFCGAFPNGEYALVLTDQYPRYPEVEFTKSTSFEGTREKLKKTSPLMVCRRQSRQTMDHPSPPMHSQNSLAKLDFNTSALRLNTPKHMDKWRD